MRISQKLFVFVWVSLVVLLAVLSLRYRSRTEALVAVVESQITAVSYHKPVTIDEIKVISGQEVSPGDTLVVVSRPDLVLDIERKSNELRAEKNKKDEAIQNHKSKNELLLLEKDGKINRLMAEKNELETELHQQKLIKQKLQKSATISSGDSLKIIELQAINGEMRDLKNYYNKEIERQNIKLRQDTIALNQSIEIIKKELTALSEEQGSLIKRAQFAGIVGVVNAQLGELIPPYKSILSIYESQPSIIKAYKNELIEAPVSPGDVVKVESQNRGYSITGTVQELGARITSYPTKIQPMNSSNINYGQEIFISIPRNNRFLNGEKVYVYPNLNGKQK